MITSWSLLSITVVSAVFLRETHAFSQRVLVPGRTLQVSLSKGSRSCPTIGKIRGIPYIEHKALSTTCYSGALTEPQSSWEEIILPHVPLEINHDRINASDKVVMAAAALAGIVAVYGMAYLTAPGAWRFFAAGGICAATSHAIPTPIDVVKVCVCDRQSQSGRRLKKTSNPSPT